MKDLGDIVNIDDNDELDVYFNFFDDDGTEVEREQFVDYVINKKNEYLFSLGYVMNEDGKLIAPRHNVVDALLGFAVGDALGVPVEFFSRKKLCENIHTEMIGFGTHSVPEGSWSDDTSLVVATMESINENGLIDYDDIMHKFGKWLEEGEYSSLDTVFDVGLTTKRAILNYFNGIDSTLCGGVDERDNGNGSLMRMLPIALYLNNCNYSFEQEIEIVNNVSSLTHAHEISCLGCKIYCDYIKQLLYGVDKTLALVNICEYEYDKYYSLETLNKYKRIFSDNFFKLSVDDIKSTGYIVDSLEASLWCLLNTDNYEDAVIKAVNLGGDTDTIGAITGSMAGIIYGKKNIPKRWLLKLKKRNYLERLSIDFEKNINDINKKNKRK